MKILTVRQPWASLIISGAKDIENREWPAYYRGPIGIHSSATLKRSEMMAACDVMASFIPRFSAARFSGDNFPLGAILGVVSLVDCVRESRSSWFFGSYGFVLRDPIKFRTPIACKGSLGLWSPSEELLFRISEEMRHYAMQPR